MNEIEKTCENCMYETESGDGFHCRNCIHNTTMQENFKPNVCEWHCDEYGRWHTECNYLADNDPLEYTFCPYCGKKIKIVGD